MLVLRNVSITVRLTLYFSVAMAIVLYSVSGLLYSTMRSQLSAKDEAELRSTLVVQKKIATTISDWQITDDQWQKELLEYVARQQRLSLRIISPDGKVHSQSQNMRVPQFDFPRATQDFSYAIWRYRNNNIKEKYLIATTRFTLKNNQEWLVQAALNVSQNNRIIESYWINMQMLVAFAIVIFALLGFWLARHGLSPLRTIHTEIEKVHAGDLQTRIAIKQWPRELNALAISFDRMMVRLESSFKQLNRFSSDIAHELRAPINNLISAASVTQSKKRSTMEYQETLAVIVEEGERLSRMVSSMLFLARADNCRETLKLEWLSSINEFEKLQSFYEILAEENNITLECRGDITFHADALLLQRALSNLLSNAIRHTQSGGVVVLDASSDFSFNYISVEDNGDGIDIIHLPHIFERFYRIDASRSMTENTGLGLAIVKTIAELHGGKIVAESKLGVGSKFTVILPKPEKQTAIPV